MTGQAADVEADAQKSWSGRPAGTLMAGLLDDVTDPASSPMGPASNTGTGWVPETTAGRDADLTGSGRSGQRQV